MKLLKYKYCIVVDVTNRPMAYSKVDEQLCYCDDGFFKDNVWPIKIVTIITARKQIQLTIENRLKWGEHLRATEKAYKLMPVSMKGWIKK